MAALEAGMSLEIASIDFYQKRLNEAQEKAEKEFLTQMIKEEQMHHRLLSDMKLYLNDPSAWFIEKERHGLDGA
jgi:rubrerythrin